MFGEILFYHWDYLSEFMYIKKRIDAVRRIQCSHRCQNVEKNRNNNHHIFPLWNSKQNGIISFLIKPSSSLTRSVHLHRITFRFSGCSKPYLKWSAFWDYLNYCVYLKYYLVFFLFYWKFAGMWWWTKCKNLTGACWIGHGCWYDWLAYCLEWCY